MAPPSLSDLLLPSIERQYDKMQAFAGPRYDPAHMTRKVVQA